MTGTDTLLINLGVTLSALIALGVFLHRGLDKRFNDLKADIRELSAEIKAVIKELRTEIKAGHKALGTAVGARRDDIGGVYLKLAEVRTDIQEVRTDIKAVRTDIQAVRTDIAKTQGKANERIARLEARTGVGKAQASVDPEPAPAS